jgi:hypothetical protein
MTWKTWVSATSMSLALAAISPAAHAFDRKDGPAVVADPSTDINDLYAWKDGATGRLFFVMTVFPDADKNTARFSSSNLYVFHTQSRSGPTDTNPAPEVNIICKFDSAMPTQTVECWAGDKEYVKGPSGNQLSSRSGNLSVMALVRNDPHFTNDTSLTAAINQIAGIVKPAARDAAGCFALNATQQTTLKTTLNPTGTVDTFKGKNVLAIVISVDPNVLVQANKPVLSVWASTNQPL